MEIRRRAAQGLRDCRLMPLRRTSAQAPESRQRTNGYLPAWGSSDDRLARGSWRYPISLPRCSSQSR